MTANQAQITNDQTTPPEEDDSRMALMDHLIELRNRVLGSLIAFLVVAVGIFIVSEPVFQFIAAPLLNELKDSNGIVQTTGIWEMMFTYLKISVYGSLMITLPFLLWQIWRFVAPGLYRNEQGVVWPFLVATPVLFWLGCLLVYVVLVPLSVAFALSITSEVVTAIPKVSEYLGYVLWLMLAFGLSFELPVLLTLLGKAGFVSAKQLLGFWKYALVGIAIVAAFLTPPDAISQIVLGVPVLALYFGSIYIIYLIEVAEGRNSFTEEEFDYSEFEDDEEGEFDDILSDDEPQPEEGDAKKASAQSQELSAEEEEDPGMVDPGFEDGGKPKS